MRNVNQMVNEAVKNYNDNLKKLDELDKKMRDKNETSSQEFFDNQKSTKP